MATNNNEAWMWAEACEMLARAERMQRQLFQLKRSSTQVSAGMPTWEPPVDVLETEDEVLIHLALPGIDIDRIDVVIEGGVLVVAGHRTLPPELRTAIIHRLEIPQGRFERRIPLPAGRYDGVRRRSVNGCLVVSLQKS